MYFSRVRLQADLLKSSQLHRVIEGNVYSVHRLLWDLFSEKKRTFLYREEIAREQLGVMANVRGEPVYYVVSQSKPVEPENSLFKVETKIYQPKLTAGQVLSFECRVNPVITKSGKKHDVVMDAQLVFLKELINKLNLKSQLSSNAKKQDYKKLLLNEGGKVLDQYLSEILAHDARYAERLMQVSRLSDKLEWAIKSQIDTTLENWWKKQGERCGYKLPVDESGLGKLQNSAYQWHALPEKGKSAGFSSVDFTGELLVTDVDSFLPVLFNGLGRSKAFGCGLLLIRRI